MKTQPVRICQKPSGDTLPRYGTGSPTRRHACCPQQCSLYWSVNIHPCPLTNPPLFQERLDLSNLIQGLPEDAKGREGTEKVE